MTRSIPSLLVALLLAASVAAAQDIWQYHTAAGEFAYAAGNVQRAEREFVAALELAKKDPGDGHRLERSLSNLARLYEHAGRFDRALPLYQLLLASQEHRFGDDSPALLDALLAVARCSVPTGDAPTADAALERFLTIADASGAADPAQRWRAASMLARMKTLEKKPEEALEAQRRAVAAMTDDPDAGDLERATELESLAKMELEHGSAEAAEKALERAVALRGKAGQSTAEPLATAAAAAFAAGQPDLAERLAEQSLADVPEAPPLAAVQVLAKVSWLRVRAGGELTDLLGVGTDQAALELADHRLQAVVQHPAMQPTADHPELVETMARLAIVAALRGRAGEAADWKSRQLDLMTAAGGGSVTPAVLAARSDLVGLLVAADREVEAAAANERLIAGLEQTYGANDSHLLAPLQRQMELLRATGRKRDAKVFKKRLRALERSLR